MLIDLGNRQGCCPGAFPLQFVSAIGTNTRKFCRWRQLARSTVKSQLRSAETLFLETIQINYTVTSDIHAPTGKNKYSFILSPFRTLTHLGESLVLVLTMPVRNFEFIIVIPSV